jgi:hypothetical protein
MPEKSKNQEEPVCQKQQTMLNKEEKIGRAPSFFVALCSGVISIFCATLTTFIISEIRDNIIPIHIYVQSNDSAFKVAEEVNSSIADNMEKLYEKSISKLNVSITLFSCALILFTIVLGFFYFTKINEVQKLVGEIQKTPEIVFKRYYRIMYEKSISNLFSDNIIQRYDAIKNLAYSSVIDIIDINDYDVLKTVLFKEIDNLPNVYFYSNTNTIVNALMKLDFDRTIEMLRNKLSGVEYDFLKHNGLLQSILVDNSNETKRFIEDKLLNEQKTGVQLVSLLMTSGVINQYVDFIIQKCSEPLLLHILNDTISDIWHINKNNLYENLMKRENITSSIIQHIILNNNKNLSIENEITILLHFYIKDKTNLEQPLRSYIYTLNNDEEKQRCFFNVLEKNDCIDSIKELFLKENRLKTYFENLFDNDERIANLFRDDTNAAP